MALKRNIRHSSIKAKVEYAENLQNEISNRVYMTGQAIWWMALYYPMGDSYDWSKEDVEQFQQLYKRNVASIRHDWANGEPMPKAKVEAHEMIYAFQDRTGLNVMNDFVRKIPMPARLMMAADEFINDKDEFERPFPMKNGGYGTETFLVLEAVNDGLHDAFLSAIHTLIKDYKFSDDTILLCLDKVVTVASCFQKQKRGVDQINLRFIVNYIGEEFGIGIEYTDTEAIANE